MSKKSKPRTTGPKKTRDANAPPQSSSVATAGGDGSGASADRVPVSDDSHGQVTVTKRVVLSLAVILHFAALVVALASNYSPSYLQGELTGWLAPYAVTTQQAYGGMALGVTHGESVDFPLRIEFYDGERRQWKASQLGLDDSAFKNSRWNQLARITRLILEEQPESEVIAELVFGMVLSIDAQSRSPIDAIRLVQPYVMSYDEYSLMQAEQEELLDGLMEGETVFSAAVIRQDDEIVGLIPTLDSARTSPPTTRGTQ